MAGRKKKEVKNRLGLILGLILTAFGLIFLLTDLGYISFNPFYAVLIIGLLFITYYALSNNWVFLIPGVILTMTSLIIIFNYENLTYLWIFTIGLSFLSVYLTREKHTKWSLIPALVLISISLVMGFNYYTGVNAWPLILIALGAYLMMKNH